MRRVLIWFVGLVVAGCVGLAIYVRAAPSDPDRWHVDPLTVSAPDFPGYYLVRPSGGSTTGPGFDMTPGRLLQEFHRVATSAPRTEVLAGSVEAGHVTYVTRSAIIGFPDYVSVKAVEDDDGARLAVFSRLRFGRADLGVNRDRIERWMAEIEAGRAGG